MSASRQDLSAGVLDEMHDGALTGLATSPSTKRMSIWMRDATGNEYEITVENVVCAAANNFRHGNTISSITITDDPADLNDVDVAELAESDEPQHIEIYRRPFAGGESGRPFRTLRIREAIGCRALIVFDGRVVVSKQPSTV